MRRQTIRVGVLVVSLFLSISSSAQQMDSAGLSTESASAILSPSSNSTWAAATGSPVPRLVKFSGVVNSKTTQMTQTPPEGPGKTQPPTWIDLTFSLYELQEGGNPLWSESQKLDLDDQGRYTALLGATAADGLPLDLFSSGKALWLGVQPQLPGAAEQLRVLLVAVPYALKAADADTLGGKPASAFLTIGSLPAITPGAPRSNSANSPAGVTSHRLEESAAINTSCPQLSSSGTALANYIAKFTAACNIERSEIFASNGNIGIGTDSPAGRLDVSGNAFIEGMLRLTSLGTATPTAGFMSNPLDFMASSFNGSAAVNQLFRWQAEPVGNNSPAASANLNLLFGSGANPAGETGLSINHMGQISFAAGQTFPGVGTLTSVASGAGLTGGPITGSGTLSVATGGVTNTMLANSSLTLNPGTDLTGGGPVSLGGSVTLNLDTTKVPTLAANTFTDSQSVTGNITATGQLSGGSASLTGALTGTTANFSGTLSAAGATLPAMGVATPSSGANSNVLDLQASSFNSSTQAPVNQDFRWMAEPTGNNSPNPSATLNLQYSSGKSAPNETGLSIGSNGVINFSSQQTFPQATATSQGVLMLTNDLAGTATAPLVTGLQGRPVSNALPAANQVLAWNGSVWAPTNSGGSGGLNGSGTSGYLAEWTAAGTLGNSPVMETSGTLTSSEPVVAPSLSTTGSGAGVVQISSGPTSVTWTLGTGAPMGACSVGSLFSRTDGAPGSTLYVCEGPSGAWVAK